MRLPRKMAILHSQQMVARVCATFLRYEGFRMKLNKYLGLLILAVVNQYGALILRTCVALRQK
jgi:hypothetical protein